MGRRKQLLEPGGNRCRRGLKRFRLSGGGPGLKTGPGKEYREVPLRLVEAFGLQDREVISLVGGGGKTALLYGLGTELAGTEKGILLTTTTKIWEPDPSPRFALILSRDLSALKRRISDNIGGTPYLVVAAGRLNPGKLEGINPRWVDELFQLPGMSRIIVEADGAAGRSLKAYRDGEPVIPGSTSLLVPVVGLDILGCPLDDPFVFRSEIASRLLDLPIGTRMTEDIVARLLLGGVKKRPVGCRVVPFINKVDSPDRQEEAKIVAEQLMKEGAPEISRVVIGQLQGDRWVEEVRPRSVAN